MHQSENSHGGEFCQLLFRCLLGRLWFCLTSAVFFFTIDTTVIVNCHLLKVLMVFCCFSLRLSYMMSELPANSILLTVSETVSETVTSV